MNLCIYGRALVRRGASGATDPEGIKEKYAEGSFCFLKRLQVQRFFVFGSIRTFLGYVTLGSRDNMAMQLEGGEISRGSRVHERRLDIVCEEKMGVKARKTKGMINVRRALVVVLTMVLVVFGAAATSQASNTAQQTVTFQVKEINEISVSGNPGALIVEAATAGYLPDAVADSSTTYAITTNKNNKKIIAALDADMPTGLTLKVNLTAPTGGTSAGYVSLSASAQDVVTTNKVVASGLTITYQLEADATADIVASDTRTATFTLADS